MSAVGVRPTKSSDITALIPFINASWVRTYAPLIGYDMALDLATKKHSTDLFLREIDAPDAVSWLAKSEEDGVAGHVGGFKTGEYCLYIDRFHISPSWHGKGVASQLAQAVENDAKAKGFERLELTVLEGNQRALTFYLKVGFSVDPTRSPTDGLGPQKALTLVKLIDGKKKD